MITESGVCVCVGGGWCWGRGGGEMLQVNFLSFVKSITRPSLLPSPSVPAVLRVTETGKKFKATMNTMNIFSKNLIKQNTGVTKSKQTIKLVGLYPCLKQKEMKWDEMG